MSLFFGPAPAANLVEYKFNYGNEAVLSPFIEVYQPECIIKLARLGKCVAAMGEALTEAASPVIVHLHLYRSIREPDIVYAWSTI